MIPIGQYILVRPYKRESITEGGLYIPDSVNKDSNKVLIVEVGSGTSKKPMKVSKGQTGFRVKDWGDEVVIDGEKHFLMHQDSIIALQ